MSRRVCRICGKEIENSSYAHMSLCSRGCFSVNFWNETLDDEAIIIDGVCYHDAGNRPRATRADMLGHGGRVFLIRMNDGRQFETNNLWCQGAIPKERGVQDNAQFIPLLCDKIEAVKDFE